MRTVNITIDGKKVSSPSGTTVFNASKKLGIDIPSLCYLPGCKAFTSCMICVVNDKKEDKLIPSCSTILTEGMVIETNNNQIREFRKTGLEFLLSEHVGDCDAPCQRSCPAHMNIPSMIRSINNKEYEKAIKIIKKDIALPAILGRICQAPCEKGCHRKSLDNAVSICKLKQFAADNDLKSKLQYKPSIPKPTGKRIAIVGAGPAGLSAAYFLLQAGHGCDIYDKNAQPGGLLRYGVPETVLPKSVLESEIQTILDLGVSFFPNQTLGQNIFLDNLRKQYHAVILSLGKINTDRLKMSGLELTTRGIKVNRKTYETTLPGVFSGGDAISPSGMAIRSSAHGKEIAFSITDFLNKNNLKGRKPEFQSILGKLSSQETEELLKEAEQMDRISSDFSPEKSYNNKDAGLESGRCFGCDCRKKKNCLLRKYAGEYDAIQKNYRFESRNPFSKVLSNDQLVYEPGKCIKCGLCVQITKRMGEKLGMTFLYRGFNVKVDVPFNLPLSKGMENSVKTCIEACPTAALSWKIRKEDLNNE